MLARVAEDREFLEASAEVAEVGLTEGEAQELLRHVAALHGREPLRERARTRPWNRCNEFWQEAGKSRHDAAL